MAETSSGSPWLTGSTSTVASAAGGAGAGAASGGGGAGAPTPTVTSAGGGGGGAAPRNVMVPPHPATKAETKTHATDSDAFMGGIFVRIRGDRNGNRAIRVDAPWRGPETGALAGRDARFGYCFRNKPRQLSI